MALFLKTLANGTWVSVLAAPSRASILTGPSGHMSLCQSTPDPSLPRTSEIEPLPIAIDLYSLTQLRWLSITKDCDSYFVFSHPIFRKPMNRVSISHLVFWTINLACVYIFATGHGVEQVSACLSWVRIFPLEDINRNMFWSESSAFIRKLWSYPTILPRPHRI